MIADKEEIHIGQVIVHILDSTVGMPVLSDKVLDYGSDFADFLKAQYSGSTQVTRYEAAAFPRRSPLFTSTWKNMTLRILLRFPRKQPRSFSPS